ncbi:NAD(P)H-dependent oxidoreductase [Corynebacterium sp. 335C]
MSHHVILVGALHAGSTNRRLAEAYIRHLPDGDTAAIHEGLRDVPFYDADRDVPGAEPEAAAELRRAVSDADAVVFVTPEYNHTAPAVLVNAIDWLSRPDGKGALVRKPALILGATPKPTSLEGARRALLYALQGLQAHVVPTVYTWTDVHTVFGDNHPADVDEVAAVLRKAHRELGKRIEEARHDPEKPRGEFATD